MDVSFGTVGRSLKTGIGHLDSSSSRIASRLNVRTHDPRLAAIFCGCSQLFALPSDLGGGRMSQPSKWGPYAKSLGTPADELHRIVLARRVFAGRELLGIRAARFAACRCACCRGLVRSSPRLQSGRHFCVPNDHMVRCCRAFGLANSRGLEIRIEARQRTPAFGENYFLGSCGPSDHGSRHLAQCRSTAECRSPAADGSCSDGVLERS